MILQIIKVVILFTSIGLVFLKEPKNKLKYGEPWEQNNFFEGDIILTKAGLQSRNGLTDEAYRWPNKVVPVQISSKYNSRQRRIILQAMATLNAVSCLHLRLKRPNDAHFVHVADRDRGCSSMIGFNGVGEQEMNLAANCFEKNGTSVHEFLHTLGFVHQHSANERDDFVKINWENIDDAYRANFEAYAPQALTSFGVEYDTGSIMHYSETAFSKNGEPTIVALHKDEGETGEMGQRDRMTDKDIWKLNAMYNCYTDNGRQQ